MASVTHAEVSDVIPWACWVVVGGDFTFPKSNSFGRVLVVHVGFNWTELAPTWNWVAFYKKLLDVQNSKSPTQMSTQTV